MSHWGLSTAMIDHHGREGLWRRGSLGYVCCQTHDEVASCQALQVVAGRAGCQSAGLGWEGEDSHLLSVASIASFAMRSLMFA